MWLLEICPIWQVSVYPPLLQGIALRSPSTEDYIVIPFYRGLHCDSLLHKITWWLPFIEDYIVISFIKDS